MEVQDGEVGDILVLIRQAEADIIEQFYFAKALYKDFFVVHVMSVFGKMYQEFFRQKIFWESFIWAD